ncbi:hypothetical protein CMUS01_04747 [Colletotrichum musicola]|uniref:Cytochrome P450 n=1 Tax=Colletotrichum musicola TaxID=2175873 RepID=A0A8H6KVT8_9PEZI|nr:hypothetical protein CMUS01_04747 [Colletotrichum musicola]
MKLVCGLGLSLFAAFFYRLYRVRSMFRDLTLKYDIPIVAHSFLFGHILVVAKLFKKHQSDVFGNYIPLFLAMEYPKLAEAGVFYVDLWPLAPPMLSVFQPDMMAQFTQDTSLPKHKMMQREFFPFTQCNDLVNQEGPEWKMWRSIYNPGFSAKNLSAMVPAFVEEIQVLKDWLYGLAETGEVVQMQGQAMKTAIDVIGRAILGVRLHCQTQDFPFYNALKNQVYWLLFDRMPSTIMKQLNPFRRLAIMKNNWIMKSFLLPYIKREIDEYQSGKSEGVKTINSLAIKAYVNEMQASKETAGKLINLNTRFVEVAISQLKVFFLAGHDTTATALCSACHLLYRNPHTLSTMRDEHDQVFGPDPTTAAAQIAANPQLLNQLPYTSAVIKETLRHYPPVGTVRQGQPDFFLMQPETGQRFPTDGFLVLSCSFTEHRMEKYFPRPLEFVPERWLAREGDALYVRKNAFRPFELGPRGCIGQELSQLELRAMLVMLMRELDIESAYADDAPEVLGEKAYQVMIPGEVTGHPKDGIPIRVKVRDWRAQMP